MGQSLSVQLIIVPVCNHLQPKEMESSDDSTCCSVQYNIPFMYFQKNIISSAKRIYCALIRTVQKLDKCFPPNDPTDAKIEPSVV